MRASQHFRSFWGAWRTIAGYEAMHMIRKAKRAGVRRVRRLVYCTASFSICSLRRAKLPIIYPVLWLDYKVATHPIRDPVGSKPRALWRRIAGHRPVQYLNNVLEQDHRAIKRRVRASQHFRSFWGAWRTIAGYEAMHMIRKGQAYGSAPAAKGGLLHCFILGLFSAVTV